MADGTTDRLRAHSVSRNGDAEFFDAHSYMHASLPLDTGLIGASAPTDLTPPHPDLQAVMNAHDTLGFCNDHQPASDRHAMSIGQEQESNMTASTMDPATMDLTLAQHIVARPFEQAQCSTSYFESYGGESSGSAHMPQAALKHHNSSGDIDGMEAFPTFKMERQRSESNLAVDPSLLTRGDPNSIGSVPGIHDSEIAYDPMASAASPHAFTPPHLMPDMTRHHSEEDQHIAATSPNFQCPDFGAFPRPRAPSDSLDPASANFTTNWNTFGTHRRTASDQYSDYSSHSNHASPYMPTLDSFDGAHSSPLLDSSQDPVFNDGLGLQGFSLNDDQQTTQTGSPAHSPIPSPRLNPQPQLPLPQFDAEGMIGVPTGDRPADLFAPLSHGYYPAAHAMSVPKDFGLADQMSPPEINIDFAPPSRPIEQHNRPVNDGEALSPLMRCMTPSRNRARAKSDSFAGARTPSPFPARGRSPSLQPNMHGAGGLSLPSSANTSQSGSPARGRDSSLGRPRSTSGASGDRDHLLNMAHPERSSSNGSNRSGRGQRHPSTFVCSLCPKRFTRAYNLRSHHRTHTDERPFECTTCGKAFARQHDRKRHEGLHTGEKKFICYGDLQSGSKWGCGRRFARADALGRHFRSEAGRLCIKRLLEEDTIERQREWLEGEQQRENQTAAEFAEQQPAIPARQLDLLPNCLPAALLQQYPDLGTIDWASISQGPAPDEEYSGRSSFDASSGGEFHENLSDNEAGPYLRPEHQNMDTKMLGHLNAQAPLGPSATYTKQASDFMNGFEGR